MKEQNKTQEQETWLDKKAFAKGFLTQVATYVAATVLVFAVSKLNKGG